MLLCPRNPGIRTRDNAMLARIVTLVADYTKLNYNDAVGGPSGASAELVDATE